MQLKRRRWPATAHGDPGRVDAFTPSGRLTAAHCTRKNFPEGDRKARNRATWVAVELVTVSPASGSRGNRGGGGGAWRWVQGPGVSTRCPERRSHRRGPARGSMSDRQAGAGSQPAWPRVPRSHGPSRGSRGGRQAWRFGGENEGDAQGPVGARVASLPSGAPPTDPRVSGPRAGSRRRAWPPCKRAAQQSVQNPSPQRNGTHTEAPDLGGAWHTAGA